MARVVLVKSPGGDALYVDRELVFVGPEISVQSAEEKSGISREMAVTRIATSDPIYAILLDDLNKRYGLRF